MIELNDLSIVLIGKYKDLLKENKIDEFFKNVIYDRVLFANDSSQYKYTVSILFLYFLENIPNFLQYISVVPSWAFGFADALTKLKLVNFPKNIMTLQSGSFSSCSGASNLPNTTVSLENTSVDFLTISCFANAHIETLILPSELKQIDRIAFAKAKIRNSIVLPNSIEDIASDAFIDASIILKYDDSQKYLHKYFYFDFKREIEKYPNEYKNVKIETL